jgi:hypothetical protein
VNGGKCLQILPKKRMNNKRCAYDGRARHCDSTKRGKQSRTTHEPGLLRRGLAAPRNDAEMRGQVHSVVGANRNAPAAGCVGVVAAVIAIGAGTPGAIARAIAGITTPVAVSRAALGVTAAPIAGAAAHTRRNAGTGETRKPIATNASRTAQAEARRTSETGARWNAAKARQRMRTSEIKVKTTQPKGMNRKKAECERGIWRDRSGGEHRARAQRQTGISQHRLSPSIQMRVGSVSLPCRIHNGSCRFPMAGLWVQRRQ